MPSLSAAGAGSFGAAGVPKRSSRAAASFAFVAGSSVAGSRVFAPRAGRSMNHSFRWPGSYRGAASAGAERTSGSDRTGYRRFGSYPSASVTGPPHPVGQTRTTDRTRTPRTPRR